MTTRLFQVLQRTRPPRFHLRLATGQAGCNLRIRWAGSLPPSSKHYGRPGSLGR